MFDLEDGIVFQAGVGHIIVDADGEVVLGLVLEHFIEDTLDHGGGEFLGGQTITPADNDGLSPGYSLSAMAVTTSM